MSQATAYTLYVLFALGGFALILMLPGVRNRKAAGIIFGLAALVGLMALLATRPGGQSALFYVLATIALLSGVRVITHTKPVYSALYFVLVVVSTAALLVLQSAEFLAVALVIIYAGAILVTYLFVIMLAQQPSAGLHDENSREPVLAVLVGIALVAVVAGHTGQLPPQAKAGSQMALAADPSLPPAAESGNTMMLGSYLFTRYVVVIELAGILLLVSMVGAIAMSRKHVATETSSPVRPLGQIGREVEPY